MSYSKSRKGRLLAAILSVVLVLLTSLLIIVIENARVDAARNRRDFFKIDLTSLFGK